MDELVRNLPTLLVVSVDLYLTYKSFQLFYWFWKDEVPPDRRMMALNMNRNPMAITNPAMEIKAPRMEWSCLPERGSTYYPEGDPDEGATLDRYPEIFTNVSRKRDTELLIPSPSQFVPPRTASKFRIACKEADNEEVCYKIDYLLPKNSDAISYVSPYASARFKFSDPV